MFNPSSTAHHRALEAPWCKASLINTQNSIQVPDRGIVSARVTSARTIGTTPAKRVIEWAAPSGATGTVVTPADGTWPLAPVPARVRAELAEIELVLADLEGRADAIGCGTWEPGDNPAELLADRDWHRGRRSELRDLLAALPASLALSDAA